MSGLGLLSPSRRAWPLVGLVLALSGCTTGPQGSIGSQGDPGDTGATGAPGAPGADAASTLVNAVSLPAGDANCPWGGTRYDTGVDNGDGGGVAGDGVLQPGEVDSSQYVCNPPGTFDYSITPPTTPTGKLVIDSSGGAGGISGGNGGRDVLLDKFVSGGNVMAFTNGTVDVSFAVPGPDHVHLGSHPLDVASGTTVSPTLVAPGDQTGLQDGTWFQYSSGTDDHLYQWSSGAAVRATGVHIEANGTLQLPASGSENLALPAAFGSRLVVPYDVQNDGVLAAAVSVNNRYPLAVWAQNYYGGASSEIDVQGLTSPDGGEGGSLWVFAVRFPENQPTSCSTGGGGIYNQGTIDTRPGPSSALVTNPVGGSITLCGDHALYNSGDLFASGRDTEGGNGGTVQLTATGGGLYNAGAITATGGSGGADGGEGTSVTLAGVGVWNTGAIDVSGGPVGDGVDCSGSCSAGHGGQINLTAAGGPLENSGRMVAAGGDAPNAGNSTGGYGGDVTGTSTTGTVVSRPPGSIDWTGDIDVHGGAGAGAGQGGDGGEGIMVLQSPLGSPSDVLGQHIALYGYQSVNAAGGDGVAGGKAGAFGLANNLDSLSMPGTFVGGTYNEVPVAAAGGQGTTSGSDITDGGEGGGLYLIAVDPLGGPYARVIDVADVTAPGGAGTYGGPNGTLQILASSDVQLSGSVDIHGGAGDMGAGAGASGYPSGNNQLGSAYGTLSISGDIDDRGGDGAEGGTGRPFTIFGQQIDISATIDASGGAGNATSGTGGAGAEIDVQSTATSAVVTGTLRSDGGTGQTPGIPGAINVDGVPWQVSQ